MGNEKRNTNHANSLNTKIVKTTKHHFDTTQKEKTRTEGVQKANAVNIHILNLVLLAPFLFNLPAFKPWWMADALSAHAGSDG